MFFKQKRRSRANSYIDSDTPPARSQSLENYNDSNHKRPESSRNSAPVGSPPPPAAKDDKDMYPRPQAPQDAYSPRGLPNGAPNPMAGTPTKTEPMPDLLAQAFNQAVRPYTERIEQLENQLADMQAWVDQLEQQRAEVHSWIDKRGLRPGTFTRISPTPIHKNNPTNEPQTSPPSIAKIMDSTTPDAANTLNAQLDRKITIVNFDLHRLQDDLNDSISSAHFASSMLKFLPDIERLSALPNGPHHAFDLVLKLGGNLNSHGGLDSADASEIAARREFYMRLDEAMVEVVRRRFGEGEEWNVGREVKRIEKTASYLAGYGVKPYFPGTLELMRSELEFRGEGNGSMGNGNGVHGGSPPGYR